MAKVTVNQSTQVEQIPIRKLTVTERLIKDKWIYFLLLPGLIWFILFKYVPMWGTLIAFQNYSPFLGFWGSEWVGFTHFERLFQNPDFYRILENTLILAFFEIVFVFPAPIILALMLNEIRFNPYKRTIQTLIYLPNFLSWVIVASLTYVFFTTSGGIVNVIVENITGSTIFFLGDPDWFRPMIVAQQIWKGAGFGTIIFLAALATLVRSNMKRQLLMVPGVLDECGTLRYQRLDMLSSFYLF